MDGDPAISWKTAGYAQFLIPQYKKEGKSQLIVGIGCTGGKHRSVAVAEYLFKTFGNSESEQLRIGHRDHDKDRS